MAVCGKVDHGRPRQSQVQQGRFSRVQPGTARYSYPSTELKYPPYAISFKSRHFKDKKYDVERLLVDPWGPCEDQMGTTWGPDGYHVGTTWGVGH